MIPALIRLANMASLSMSVPVFASPGSLDSDTDSPLDADASTRLPPVLCRPRARYAERLANNHPSGCPIPTVNDSYAPLVRPPDSSAAAPVLPAQTLSCPASAGILNINYSGAPGREPIPGGSDVVADSPSAAPVMAKRRRTEVHGSGYPRRRWPSGTGHFFGGARRIGAVWN